VKVKPLSCSSSKTDVFCLAGQLTEENLVAWFLAASGVRKIMKSVQGKCKSHCVDIHTPLGHWGNVLIALEKAPFLAKAHKILKEEADVKEYYWTVPRQLKQLKQEEEIAAASTAPRRSARLKQ
jgi:glyceraldehyde-3-phosphate dehydrogenase/erythrose-4-phosphate dehydrogenase